MKYQQRHVSSSDRGDGRSILRAANMSTRPEYYSGRGAIACDLSGEQLCAIYESVATHHGVDAGAAFLKMVNELPKLTATDFILAFYRLENSEWAGVSSLGEEKGMYISAPADTREGQMQGMHGLVAALAGGASRDESTTILCGFRASFASLRVLNPELVPKSAKIVLRQSGAVWY